jgi:hypothetical protein
VPGPELPESPFESGHGGNEPRVSQRRKPCERAPR